MSSNPVILFGPRDESLLYPQGREAGPNAEGLQFVGDHHGKLIASRQVTVISAWRSSDLGTETLCRNPG